MSIQGVVAGSGNNQPARQSHKSAASGRWSPRSLYFELKRRGVLEAGTSYIVVSWLIAQVAELIGEIFNSPAWLLQALLIALAIGLPVALVLSWAFELTPGGLKRESEVTPVESVARQKGRGLVCALIAVLVLTIGALVVNRESSICTISPQASVHQADVPEKS